MDWEGERAPIINEVWAVPYIENSWKNSLFWKPKLKKIMKKVLPKTMFFSRAFWNRFSRVWGGFGGVLAGVWDLLGRYCGIIGLLFFRLCDQEGPRDGQEVSWVRF